MHDTRHDAVLERDATRKPQAKTLPIFPPVERRTTQAPPDREKLLYDLADQARARGMNNTEWYENQNIGPCPAQVNVRIEMLRDWLTAHPAQ